MTIILCMVPEICSATDRIFCQIWTIFCPFTCLTTRKFKTLKNWKKYMEILSFYISVPKIMIICCTVPEIWHVTDVIVIFHLRLLFPFYLPNSPKNQNKWKKHMEISSFYNSVSKIMIICFTVLDIWHVTDVIVFHFGPFFGLLPP